jgi:hypothetical protein
MTYNQTFTGQEKLTIVIRYFYHHYDSNTNSEYRNPLCSTFYNVPAKHIFQISRHDNKFQRVNLGYAKRLAQSNHIVGGKPLIIDPRRIPKKDYLSLYDVAVIDA